MIAWFWNPRLWTIGPAHYTTAQRRWRAWDFGPLRIERPVAVALTKTEERP